MSWAKGLRSGFTRGETPRRWAQVMVVGWFFVRLYYDDRPSLKHRGIHFRFGNRIIFLSMKVYP